MPHGARRGGIKSCGMREKYGHNVARSRILTRRFELSDGGLKLGDVRLVSGLKLLVHLEPEGEASQLLRRLAQQHLGYTASERLRCMINSQALLPNDMMDSRTSLTSSHCPDIYPLAVVRNPQSSAGGSAALRMWEDGLTFSRLALLLECSVAGAMAGHRPGQHINPAAKSVKLLLT